MLIKHSKSIQELYDETGGYELVITNDPTLAGALNSLINKPMIGRFAYTPKELGGKYSKYYFGAKRRAAKCEAFRLISEPILSKPKVILTISKKLNKDIKTVHNAIEKILEIRNYTKSIENHLNNDELLIYKEFLKLPTLERVMELFEPDKYLPKKVAVIGYEFFNELDKEVLPKSFERIDIFKEYKKELNNFYIFDSEKDLGDKILELINKENENNIAIILDSDSEYVPLIESKLYSKDINIIVKEYLKDNIRYRSFIDFLSVSLNLDSCYVRDLKPFLELLGYNIEHEYLNYLFSKYVEGVNQSLEEIYYFLKELRNKTFKDCINLFENRKIELPQQLKDVLVELDLYNEAISYENIHTLTYYINNFDIELNHHKKGVLFRDCKDTVYIDKPICIYVGLDSSWTKQLPDVDYINKEREEENNLNKFQILISQGNHQYYFVNGVKNNQKVMPCFYFNKLCDKEINGFEDDIFNSAKIKSKYSENSTILESNNEKEDKSKSEHDFTCFSQSKLNSFVQCPKKYEFDMLSPKEEQKHFLKGNLLHEFAEFYINYKDFVNEKGDEYFAEIMLNEYLNMVENINKDLEKTNFLIGIKSLKNYIDSLELDESSSMARKIHTEDKNHSDQNIFSKLLNKPLHKPNTEVYFEDSELGLKGTIDLVVNDSLIVDYKTSKAKTVGEIVKNANINLIKDNVDFQPIVYLSKLRLENPNKTLHFHYYFIFNNKKDVINGEGDYDSNIVKITYYPFTFNEYFLTDECQDILLSKGARSKLLNYVGKKDLAEFLKSNPIPEDEQFNENYDGTFFKKFLEFSKGFSNTKTMEKACMDYYKELVNIRTGKSRNFKTALFFKEDLDKFDEFLKEQIQLIKTYIANGFPKKPLSKKVCENCPYYDKCFKGVNYGE